MLATVVKLGGLALTLACWRWAGGGQRSDAWNAAIIWCAPLFAYPISIVGRRALDAHPVIRRAEWTTILVHYAMMISLGAGIFPAFRLARKSPGIQIPLPPRIGLALVILTGFAAFLTVLNLAVRGLGAPFAVKLSSKLATGWTYAWTRNPMLLCSLAWLFSLGLWYRSFSPGWIFSSYTLTKPRPAA